jgi:hypothetical protein
MRQKQLSKRDDDLAQLSVLKEDSVMPRLITFGQIEPQDLPALAQVNVSRSVRNEAVLSPAINNRANAGVVVAAKREVDVRSLVVNQLARIFRTLHLTVNWLVLTDEDGVTKSFCGGILFGERTCSVYDQRCAQQDHIAKHAANSSRLNHYSIRVSPKYECREA